MAQRGLRGIGVLASHTHAPRFLHPREAGYLNTLSPCFVHLPDLRAALCLIGQIAAPAQSLWICGLLRQWAAKLDGVQGPAPLALLQQYKTLLLQQRHDHWPLPSMQMGGTVLLDDGICYWEVKLAGQHAVWQLLQAEADFKEQGFKLRLWQDGRSLSAQALLHPGTSYFLEVRPKAQAKLATATPRGGAPASVAPSLPSTLPAEAISPISLPDPCPPSPRTACAALHPPDACTDAALFVGLQHLQSCFPARPVLSLPPLLSEAAAELIARTGPLLARHFCSHSEAIILVPFLAQHHWALLVLAMPERSLQARLFDGIPGRSTTAANALVDACCAAVQATSRHLCHLHYWLQHDETSCGAYVLAHAAAVISGNQHPLHVTRALAFLQSRPPLLANLSGSGGLSPDQTAALTTLLLDKGVPQSEVAARIQGAITKLGAAPIAQALQSKIPWQGLKGIASRPDSMFRWIQPLELQDHIALRAQQRFGTSVPKAKAKKQKPAKPAKAAFSIDPAQLQLSPGSFCSAEGGPLCQLAFPEVKSQATGVCFCTPQQAAPFLADARSLSVDALGLLITAEVPLDSCGHARVSALRFPAIYTPTQEAILIAGSLMQLGDADVQIASSDMIEVEAVDTITVRVSLYKDQTRLPWDRVVEAPVRTLIQGTPELQVCRNKACDQSCQMFHAAVDETVEQLFLDLWARAFCKQAGGRVKPQDSELFQFLARIPSSAIGHVFRIAAPGIFFDPRAPDGSPHASWGVVWLPGMSFQQAQHALQTQGKALALVRLDNKYGVRTRDVDEEAVFLALRPGHDYQRLRVSAHYRLHPLPFGYQRQSITQLLRQWNWCARPLQPEKGDGVGTAWTVGSATEPPAPALPLGQGFVLITKVKEVGGRKPSAHALCASQRTRKYLLLDDDDGEPDPWQTGQDPWAAARFSQATPARADSQTASSSVTKLAQIQEDLKQNVQTLVKQHVAAAAAPPGLTEQDRRINELEVGLTELKHQTQKFETWFQNFGTKVSDQAQAVATLQTQVHEQRQDITKCRSELQVAVSSLQSEMSSQLASQLQGQFEQIQALFSGGDKKARTS